MGRDKVRDLSHLTKTSLKPNRNGLPPHVREFSQSWVSPWRKRARRVRERSLGRGFRKSGRGVTSARVCLACVLSRRGKPSRKPEGKRRNEKKTLQLIPFLSRFSARCYPRLQREPLAGRCSCEKTVETRESPRGLSSRKLSAFRGGTCA
jgi:hypothetical protein